MKISNVNPFDFSKKVVRLADNTMKNVVAGRDNGDSNVDEITTGSDCFPSCTDNSCCGA